MTVSPFLNFTALQGGSHAHGREIDRGTAQGRARAANSHGAPTVLCTVPRRARHDDDWRDRSRGTSFVDEHDERPRAALEAQRRLQDEALTVEGGDHGGAVAEAQ